MALYSVGVRTAAPSAAGAFCDLRSAGTDRLFVREIGVFIATAVALTLGLGRPATLGTATTPVAGQAVEADPGGTGTVGTVWSAAPTAPTIYLRRASLPATIGQGFIWTFGPHELAVPISSSLVLWNITAGAGPALDAYFVWDE